MYLDAVKQTSLAGCCSSGYFLNVGAATTPPQGQS
jgi:hypothetical protein